jgi:hypothetical protein
MSAAENPWNLTPLQVAAMDSLIQHRCAKRAADRMGISRAALNERVKDAKRKMGLRSQGVFAHVLEFDRWRQANKEQA